MSQPAPSTDPWDGVGIVVLVGGSSSRLGGRDKTALPLAGSPAPVRILDAVPARVPVVAVGPSGHPAAEVLAGRAVRWTREEPAGGGPVAGLAAGLAALRAGQDDVRLVLVVAGDQPFAGTALPRLLDRLRAADAPAAVLGQDPTGRRQPLLAGYDAGRLAAVLADGPPAGRSLRSVVAALGDRAGDEPPGPVVTAPVSAAEALDLDTAQDVEDALALLDLHADDAADGPSPRAGR